MSKKIQELLSGRGGNYIFPFLWLRGEDEATIREYMRVIDESNIGAVCVESRPHPDFCGPKWWQDMDVILDEAKKRGMKVWILDDSHFPTGYANGAMAQQPDELCRQSICCRKYECTGGQQLRIEKEQLAHPDPFVPSRIEQFIGEKDPRKFEDDLLLALYAVSAAEERVNLLPLIDRESGVLKWTAPEGAWKVYALHLTRNMGYHRSYINMMSASSCRVLLDAVYEPHYARYKEEFGKTIEGFFSDEPELGNGHLYDAMAMLGQDLDYPWSGELEEALQKKLGAEYAGSLYLLWENDASAEEKARVRYAYMDAVTELVKKDFSMQIGNWCRERGVKYIGHLIEDNNQHARTGSSLGHYFRGLAGQDMAGIDDIGGQVLPQGEDVNVTGQMFGNRIGEFYHYMMGKLASSAAAIEPGKHGDSMCEIFGAYGWSEGVRLEKYLVDHFLVRGVNHFVPHAFSMAEYPDRDCPPHFYAHGNNPQYRHFGKLMAYTNRLCSLISGGHHVAPAAILYHGEGEWTGEYMESHRPGHLLCDAQIDYDIIPQEVFAQRSDYRVSAQNGILQVNTQKYRVFLIPRQQFITKALAEAIEELCAAGVQVAFVDGYPQGICDIRSLADAGQEQSDGRQPVQDRARDEEDRLLAKAKKAALISLEDVVSWVKSAGIAELQITPADDRIRYYHYEQPDGTGVLLWVNEGTRTWKGEIQFADDRECIRYDAWNDQICPAERCGDRIVLELMPQESAVFLFGADIGAVQGFVPQATAEVVSFGGAWKRSICRSIEYPAFRQEKNVSLPDCLHEEEPEFSGFVRYENTFEGKEDGRYLLEITDAHEGVEVFVNGKSLGIQIVPVFRYDLTDAVCAGKNELVIEVATTLERENAGNPGSFGQKTEPVSKSGITGEVTLCIAH